MIPYGKQDISQQDIDGVVDVLKSDFLTQGPQVPEFEKALRFILGRSMHLRLIVQLQPFMSRVWPWG